MSEIGSLVVRLEANTAALQKVDAELASLQSTIKTFENAARRGGERVQEVFGGLGKTVQALPRQFSALTGVMALQSGVISEFGGTIGKVANKLAQLGAIAATGGVVGVGIAALTGLTSLLALANRDAAAAAEAHADAMKKAQADIDNQRKAIEDLERETRALGKTKVQAAIDEIDLEIQKREEIARTARAEIEAAQKRIDAAQKRAGGTQGQRGELAAMSMNRVAGQQEDLIKREQEHIAKLQEANALSEQRIEALKDQAARVKQVASDDERAAKAAERHAKAMNEAARKAKEAADAHKRLADQLARATEEQFRDDSREAARIKRGETLEGPAGLGGPRMSVLVRPGVDQSRSQAEVDAEFQKAQASLRGSARSIGEALQQAAATIISRSGELGQVMASAVQGFQAGGPLGAIAAVLADLVSRSKAFKDTQAAADEAIGELVDAFEPLAEAMKPLAGLVHNLIGIIADQLGPLFETIGPIFEGVFHVIRGVLIGILNVFAGLGKAWNAVVGGLESLINKIPGVDVDFSRLEINLNGINGAIRKLHETTEGSTRTDIAAAAARRDADERAAEAIGGLADQAEELLNAPAGFKVERYRYEAINPSLGGGMGAGGGGGEGGMPRVGAVYNIGSVNALNVRAALDELEIATRQRNFEMSGLPIRGMYSFSTPNGGAG